MNLHFDCTQCGKCCQGLRLTLSVDEAIVWAGRGHTVQLLVEALPWPPAPNDDPARALHDENRSFPAMSGSISLRVAVVLAAHHEGGCPHLQPDLRCGNYEERPRICRIYPLESKPFTPVSPARRLCPPEAWTPDRPLLMHGETIADAGAAQIVADHRSTIIADTPRVALACETLGTDRAAFANEGLAVHQPSPAALTEALREARDVTLRNVSERSWTIVSNRRSTLSLLQDAGCEARLIRRGADYLGSFEDEA
jgi:Predicted Fe-S-cluster oxidoreductase